AGHCPWQGSHGSGPNKVLERTRNSAPLSAGVGRTEIQQMTWLQAWKAIAARIDALSQATTLYYQSTARVGADNYGVADLDIIPACHAIVEALTTFSKGYEPFVPPAA